MSVELIPHDDPYADVVFSDPRPKSVDVYLDAPKADGVPPSHRLKESTEGTYLDYQAARAAGAKLEDGVITGMGSGAGADAVLLAGCLFKLSNGGKTEAQLSLNQVRALPSRVAEPLVARLKIISGISDLETADQLRRRIAADTKKLEKLEAGRAGDTGPKGSPTASPGTSGCAPSGGAPSDDYSAGVPVPVSSTIP